MRAALVVVVCLFLTLAILDAKKFSKRPRRRRKNIWSSITYAIRQNAYDIGKLTGAIDETKQPQQELGPIVSTLKENVDDMKKGFLSMTLMMAQMKTSMTDMKDRMDNLQQIIGTETETGSGSPPGIRNHIYAEY